MHEVGVKTMKADSPNKTTLATYNRLFKEYIKSTPKTYDETHMPLVQWIDHALSLIPTGASILEIGSGPGRDAQYIKNKNYNILCSDGAICFVDHLKATGHQAIKLDILHDDIPGEFDFIFANAVAPCMTPTEVRKMFFKIHAALKPNGLFAVNFKEGEGSHWVTEKLREKRYVHYWQRQDIERVIDDSGFKICRLKNGIKGDLSSHIWTQVTLQKC